MAAPARAHLVALGRGHPLTMALPADLAANGETLHRPEQLAANPLLGSTAGRTTDQLRSTVEAAIRGLGEEPRGDRSVTSCTAPTCARPRVRRPPPRSSAFR